MPLTDYQRSILSLLRRHRNPNSYVAGGIAIHRAAGTMRYSNDVDLFHDTDESVTLAAKLDLELLNTEGYAISILISQPSFVRAVITRGQDSLKLEWVRDTAFRFFPVIPDDELGFRLHDVDLAINKCLALANRLEVRDILDLLQLNGNVMELGIACWAACGKDPGFTPEMLIDYMRRHSIIRPEQLAAESLTKRVAPSELKKEWLELLEAAQKLMKNLPVEDLGCIYLDKLGVVVRAIDPRKLDHYKRHFGSVGGSWPQVVK